MTSLVTNTLTRIQARFAPKNYSPFSFIKNLFTKSNSSAVNPTLAGRLSSPQGATQSYSLFSFIKNGLMNCHPSSTKPNLIGRLSKGIASTAKKQALSAHQFILKNSPSFSSIGNWLANCHPSAPKPNFIGRLTKEAMIGSFNDSSSKARKTAERSILENKKV